MNASPSIVHIIVAAGSGSRFGAKVPKQFCELAGIPVVMHAINRLRAYGRGGRVVLVLSEDMVDFWHDLCLRYDFDSPEIVTGGATRWQSVKNAIDLCCADADIISVHDGARPLVSREVIERVLDAAAAKGAAVVPAIAVTDSLRRAGANGKSEAVDRSSYRAVQTPQAFDGALLRRAYSMPFRHDFTDDASVAESIGAAIAIVEGSPLNIKITNPRDIAIAEILLDDSSLTDGAAAQH